MVIALFNTILSRLRPRLAVDLGTANTLIYERGKGIILNEPSFVATRQNGKRSFVAFGKDAKHMDGKAPTGVQVTSPMKGGVISNFSLAEAMLGHFLERARPRWACLKPEMVIGVPAAISAVERRAVFEAAESANAGQVLLVEEAMAGALGAGLPVMEASASLIIDIGGGTTDVAVISLGGVVVSESIRVAGESFDEHIADHIKRKHHIAVGKPTAERVKLAVGTARPTDEQRTVSVTGRDLQTGLPRTIDLSEDEICEAIRAPIQEIIRTLKQVLEQTPPELAADISDTGIAMVGGGSLLRELDRVIEEETKVPVSLAEDPLSAVALGCGRIVDDLKRYRQLVKHADEFD